MPRFRPPGQCPACGEWVPRNAAECDCCGASAASDWKSGTYDGLDLPEDDFDYEAFIEEEFGTGKKKRGMNALWWWVAVVLIAVLGYGLLAPLWR